MNQVKFNAEAVYIVTGAAGGIGSALCKALLQRGCTVIATDIDTATLQRIALKNQATYGENKYTFRSLDVRNDTDFNQLVDSAYQSYGRVDGLINNAGIMSSGEFASLDLTDWRKVIDINLMGVVNGSHAAYITMKKQGFGKIVNVSSTAGITPVLKSTAYAASKHAVVGLTNSLRGEARSTNIDIHLVIPGLIDTNIFDSALDDDGGNSRKMANAAPIKKLSAETAADIIIKGLINNKPEIIFPFANRLIVLTYRLFPQFMAKQIMRAQRHS